MLHHGLTNYEAVEVEFYRWFTIQGLVYHKYLIKLHANILVGIEQNLLILKI